MTITRRQAESVAQAVRDAFPTYFKSVLDLETGALIGPLSRPEDVVVVENDGSFHVAWEGGPYEWAYGFGVERYVNHEFIGELTGEFGLSREQATEAMTEREVATLPEGVGVEPWDGYELSVFED